MRLDNTLLSMFFWLTIPNFRMELGFFCKPTAKQSRVSDECGKEPSSLQQGYKPHLSNPTGMKSTSRNTEASTQNQSSNGEGTKGHGWTPIPPLV